MSDPPSSFRASLDGIPEIEKAPAAVLDYSISWVDWLQASETISTAAWTVPDGLTDPNTDMTSPVATIWLGGGTADVDYVVSATITTNQGRTDTRSLRLLCRAR